MTHNCYMDNEEITYEEACAKQLEEWKKQFADDPEHPCINCNTMCDGWEAKYCCTLCRYLGDGEYDEGDMGCDDCGPWDI